MNRGDKTLGMILIMSGLAMFLLNTDVLPDGAFLMVLGAAFLVGYYNKKSSGYLIVGCVLLGIGAGSVMDALTRGVDFSGFFVLTSLGIAFLVGYFRKGIGGFIYPGFILPAVGMFSILDSMGQNVEMGWSFFILLAIAFFLIYRIETKHNGRRWPGVVAVLLLMMGSLVYLTENDILSVDFWTYLNYAWPILLILIGGRILYNGMKHSHKK